MWDGKWFVFLVEPCAAGKDVGLFILEKTGVRFLCASGWQGQQVYGGGGNRVAPHAEQ